MYLVGVSKNSEIISGVESVYKKVLKFLGFTLFSYQNTGCQSSIAFILIHLMHIFFSTLL